MIGSMTKAFVLGAGASRGSTLPAHARPPVLREFFARGVSLARKSDPKKFHALLTWLRKSLGIRCSALRTGARTYEDVLSLVETAQLLQVHFPGENVFSHLNPTWYGIQLAELAQFVLEESTRICAAGTTCIVHDELAQSIGKSDIVISFNYDLIMDASLNAVGLLETPEDYGFSFAATLSSGRLKLIKTTAGPWEDCRYFKLHGSANWYETSPHEHSDHKPLHFIAPLSELRSNPSNDDIEKILERHYAEPMLARPVIVPPSFLKSGSYSVGRRWARLWTWCSRRLAKCSDWVVIGYSFGHGDIDAEWLVRTAGRRASTPTIHIVDPQVGAVAQRLEKCLEGVRYRWGGAYKSLEDFVARSELLR